MARQQLAADDPRHGTINGYSNYGCRCDACKCENSARNLEYMHRTGRRRPAAEMLKPLTDPDDPRHGTAGAWAHHKCRCDICRQYAREYQASYRARRKNRG